jgi:hypothetical protein
MPTEPHPDLVPRTVDPSVEALLNSLGGILDEVTNFGSRVLDWHNDACVGRSDEVAPVVFLLRHLLELVDAIAVLVRSSVVEPSQLCLRSLFETSLQLDWILDADSTRRGMSFMSWHVHRKLSLYERFDRSTKHGKQVASELKGTVYDQIDASQRFDLPKARANLESLLLRPQYLAIEAEYQNLKRSLRRKPDWYQLFGGPSNIRELAKRLDRLAEYEVLYRSWSGLVHGTDIFDQKMVGRGREMHVVQLRNPAGVEMIISFSIMFASRSFRKLFDVYMPERVATLRDWYKTEIQTAYRAVSSRTLLNVTDT